MKKLGIYIHIPFCLSRCIYCDFVSSIVGEHDMDEYIEHLTKEMKMVSSQIKYHYLVDTVYIGGGTPSTLTARQLGSIVLAIRKYFKTDIQEFTIEANPCNVDEKKMLTYKRAGVTRISFGVQTFNDDILASIGRRHTAHQAIESIQLAQRFGFRVSIDSMLGPGGQSMQDIDDFVSIVRELDIRHVSSYMLKVEQGTPLAKMVDSGQMLLPDDDQTCDMYDHMWQELEKIGLHRYEISNFAMQGEESKHNLKYWNMDEYIGFGVSAHSLLGNRRLYNPSSFDKYYDYLDQNKLVLTLESRLTTGDMKNERIMLSLRTSKGLDIERFDNDFDTDFLVEYKSRIDKVADYVTVDANHLSIKPEYMGVMNSIIVELID